MNITIPSDATVRAPTLEGLSVALFDYLTAMEKLAEKNPTSEERVQVSIDRESATFEASATFLAKTQDGSAYNLTFENYLQNLTFTMGTNPGEWAASNPIEALVKAVRLQKKKEIDPLFNREEQYISIQTNSVSESGSLFDVELKINMSVPLEFFGDWPQSYKGKAYIL